MMRLKDRTLFVPAIKLRAYARPFNAGFLRKEKVLKCVEKDQRTCRKHETVTLILEITNNSRMRGLLTY